MTLVIFEQNSQPGRRDGVQPGRSRPSRTRSSVARTSTAQTPQALPSSPPSQLPAAREPARSAPCRSRRRACSWQWASESALGVDDADGLCESAGGDPGGGVPPPLHAVTDIREIDTKATAQARQGPESEVRDVMVSYSPDRKSRRLKPNCGLRVTEITFCRSKLSTGSNAGPADPLEPADHPVLQSFSP